MSKRATTSEITAALELYGERATLITISDEGRPHVTTSPIRVSGDELIAGIGARSRTNLEQRPTITLLWQPPADGEYQLIIDGTATRIDEPDATGVSTAHITVDAGIQHRIAGLPTQNQSCRAVNDI